MRRIYLYQSIRLRVFRGDNRPDVGVGVLGGCERFTFPPVAVARRVDPKANRRWFQVTEIKRKGDWIGARYLLLILCLSCALVDAVVAPAARRARLDFCPLACDAGAAAIGDGGPLLWVSVGVVCGDADEVER